MMLLGVEWTQQSHGAPVYPPNREGRIFPTCGASVAWNIEMRSGSDWVNPEPYGQYPTPEAAALALTKYVPTLAAQKAKSETTP